MYEVRHVRCACLVCNVFESRMYDVCYMYMYAGWYACGERRKGWTRLMNQNRNGSSEFSRSFDFQDILVVGGVRWTNILGSGGWASVRPSVHSTSLSSLLFLASARLVSYIFIIIPSLCCLLSVNHLPPLVTTIKLLLLLKTLY